jgi:hypothetical protein
VAAEVALVLGGVSDDVLATGPLTLPLALSVCMERHGTDPEGLMEAMRLVRTAVVCVAGLDPAAEPVPLGAGDPRRGALALADYLLSLLRRAGAATTRPLGALAAAAAAHLAGSADRLPEPPPTLAS